jgi:oligopeptide/dipeptide ABC transporter ATP-binding protein
VSAAPAPPADDVLLEVDGLVTRYPVPRGAIGTLRNRPRLAVHAVDGVSFRLARGEMLALVGESGCGKTSTAQTIMRLIDADAGSVRIAGTDITSLSVRAMRPLRRRMQIIYQDPYESLDPRFRVRDTVEEPMLIHGVGSSRDDRERRVAEALDRAGLSPPELYLDRYPHELSGGQRQRVAIAASLVLGPELLVADEPVSMLDVSVRAGILSLLDELRLSGLGILMITHDLSTAAHYADRIAVMYLGRIVEEGPAQSVIRNPQHPYTRALVSVVPKRDPTDTTRPQILRGETPNSTSIPSGCRFHPRCPAIVPDVCPHHDPPLRTAEDSPSHRAACIHVGNDPLARPGGAAVLARPDGAARTGV